MLLMLNVGLPIAYSVGFSAMIVGFFTYGTVALEKLGWTTFHTMGVTRDLDWVSLLFQLPFPSISGESLLQYIPA
jgi:hypothetical protein